MGSQPTRGTAIGPIDVSFVMTPASRPRRAALLGALVLTTVTLAGCADIGGVTPNAGLGHDWVEPDRYQYTMSSTCGERNGLGTFRLTVRDGDVVEAEKLRRYSDLLPLAEMPTVGDILAIAEQADDEGADDVSVEWSDDGEPRARVDRLRDQLDRRRALLSVRDITPR